MKHLFFIMSILLLLSACTGNRRYQTGTTAYIARIGGTVVVDCDMTLEEALTHVPEECPPEIIQNLALVEVFYYGFDNSIHRGQILMDYRLADDIQSIFSEILAVRFPIYGAIPINHSSYSWSDFNTTPEGNTYSFHYRNIPFENRLSYHSYGQAVDINPILNPFRKWGVTFPPDGTYDPEEPGTLYSGHPVVKAFKRHGWQWGGDWRRKDYQHFQKPLTGNNDIHLGSNPGKVYWPDSRRRSITGKSYYSLHD